MRKYAEIQPDIELREFIKRYWVLDVTEPMPSEMVNRIIPEGLFEIVINYKSPYYDVTKSKYTLSNCFINGPFNTYRIFETTGSIGIFAIDFTPKGWYVLSGYEGSEFTDKIVPVDLLNKDLQELSTKLLEAENNAERVIICNKSLSNLCKKKKETFFPVQEIIFDLSIYQGNIAIELLSQKHNCSLSKFERNFKRFTGLSPKKYSKLIRFRNILDLGLQKPWADFIFDLGFYDQAHFIKEFKKFIGITPHRYFKSKMHNKLETPDKRSITQIQSVEVFCNSSYLG